jgi:hypothetical protein
VACRTLLPASPAEETPATGISFIDQSKENKLTNARMNPAVRVEPYVTSICQTHVTYLQNFTIKTKTNISSHLQEKPRDTTADKSWMPNMIHKFPSETFLAKPRNKIMKVTNKMQLYRLIYYS